MSRTINNVNSLMPPFTMSFPELAHLPPAQRKEIVTHCLSDPAFAPLRARYARFGKIFPFIAALATYVLTSLVPLRNWWIVLGAITLSVLVAVAFVTALRLWSEARLLRRLVRNSLSQGMQPLSGLRGLGGR
jgi:hypothetical protein